MIHVSRSGAQIGVFDEARVREGLRTGEFIGTDLGWTGGMATWRPLSELESFHVGATPPPVQPTPAAAPLATSTAPSADATSAARPGLPWENRDSNNFVNALVETLVMVLTRPNEAFTKMKREGGFVDPLVYALIFGVIGGVVSLMYSFLTQSIGLLGSRDSGAGMLANLGVNSAFGLVLLPVAIVVGMFVGAAITHVCLMIVGGANQNYETTLRVLAYGSGSANVCQLIPFCGGFVSLVYSLVVNSIGLARAHETDTWRAVVAILLPIVVCCGGSMLLVFLIVGSLAGLADWR